MPLHAEFFSLSAMWQRRKVQSTAATSVQSLTAVPLAWQRHGCIKRAGYVVATGQSALLAVCPGGKPQYCSNKKIQCGPKIIFPIDSHHKGDVFKSVERSVNTLCYEFLNY